MLYNITSQKIIVCIIFNKFILFSVTSISMFIVTWDDLLIVVVNCILMKILTLNIFVSLGKFACNCYNVY